MYICYSESTGYLHFIELILICVLGGLRLPLLTFGLGRKALLVKDFFAKIKIIKLKLKLMGAFQQCSVHEWNTSDLRTVARYIHYSNKTARMKLEMFKLRS